MKITFLGTGTSQGIPVINCSHPVCFSENKKDKRLRVSILFEWDDYKYVIDCGPDFRYQMLRAKVSKIDGILFTHEHSDHVAGLDDIRPFSFQLGALPIYLTTRVLENIRKRFDYIFEDKNRYPGAPSVAINIIKNKPFMLNGLAILPVKANHNEMEVFGFRFHDVAYMTDVKTIDDEEKLKLKNLKILIINALRIKKHLSHLNLDEALQLIDELKPERAYLTHISHYLGFHDEVESQLPKNVFLAYDELEITL